MADLICTVSCTFSHYTCSDQMATSIVTGVQCMDCKSEYNCHDCLPLQCRHHFICTSKCLPDRAIKNVHPVLQCTVCSGKSTAQPEKVPADKAIIQLETVSNGPVNKPKPEETASINPTYEPNACEPVTSQAKVFNPSTYSFKDALLSRHSQTKAVATVPSKTKVNSDQTSLLILPGIFIFVDDSNIWIEAKKLQSKLKRFKTGEDHRVRIDVGKLADVIAVSRPIQQGTLYGSEPPPVDTVWQKIRDCGWRVQTDHRHALTGKEKKVDTRLVAEVTALAIRTPEEERTTIVLVTGDADAIPAIEEVMKEERWMIEVYMWKHAMSRDITAYAKAPENSRRVQIKFLDHYLDRVSFTHMRFDISNKRLRPLVNAYGVVFTMEKDVFRKHIPTSNWLNQLESIAQWPFQYYWFKRPSKKRHTNHLVVVFMPDKKAKEFDVAQFLENIQLDSSEENGQKYRLPHTLKVQIFRQFIATEFKIENPELEQIDAALEQVGIYQPEDVHDGCERVYESEPSDEFTTHLRNPRGHHRLRQKYSDACPLKFNCRDGTGCQYKHSAEEIDYFKQRKQGRGNPVRKVSQCKVYNCLKAAKVCEYAHGPEDAWCLNCLCSGHFTAQCKGSTPESKQDK